MASRPSSGTPRSKKSSTRTLPPVTTVTNEEQTRADAETAENRAADGVVGEAQHGNQSTERRNDLGNETRAPNVDARSSDVQITGSNLQQRELPSLSDSRESRIAEAAYWRAERRGFEPGHELEDWLHAERQVDQEGSK